LPELSPRLEKQAVWVLSGTPLGSQLFAIPHSKLLVVLDQVLVVAMTDGVVEQKTRISRTNVKGQLNEMTRR